MTFQRRTAQRIIELVRALRPGVRVAVGGYDPSLAPDAYVGPSTAAADFIVRGEGELTFRALLRAIERGSGFEAVARPSVPPRDHLTPQSPPPLTRLQFGPIPSPQPH